MFASIEKYNGPAKVLLGLIALTLTLTLSLRERGLNC